MARPLRATSMTIGLLGDTRLTVRIGGGAAALLEATADDVSVASDLMAAVLMQAPMRRLPVGKALSIAYLADRMSIMHDGEPVCEGGFRTEATGPVNALMHGLATAANPPAAWSDRLTVRDGTISLRGDVACEDLGELSMDAWDSVVAAWQALGPLTEAEGRTRMWNLPEAQGRPGGIPLRTLMAVCGVRSPDAVIARNEDHRRFKRTLAMRVANDGLDKAV